MMSRYARIAAVVVAAAGLAGCASPLALAPSTPEAEVVRALGQPDAVHTLAGGARRLEYRIDPLLQTKYMVDLGPDGRVRGVAQVHDFDRFMRLRIGVDTLPDVQREFGAPRLVQHYALGRLTAWFYPYREARTFNNEMAVYFDAQGKVQRVESGPDLRFIGGGGRRDD